MRRRIGVLVAVFALVGVASGCSLREVQLWFAVNKHQTISREQAEDLADLVNAKRAVGGCDGNYSGACVPDNATSVHCAGQPGTGPAVVGSLTVTGWDSFELDTDGDKRACVDPVGAFDVFGQELGNVVLRGWAFDPDAGTGPIDVVVSDNGFISNVTANGSRGDLEAALPGVGANHGFSMSIVGGNAGDAHVVCVALKNVGPGRNLDLGCRTFVMTAAGTATFDPGTPDETTVTAMIEGADLVPGGVRVRGYAYDADGGLPARLSFSAYLNAGFEGGADHGLVRSDVNALNAFPAGSLTGFDFIYPDTVNGQPGYPSRVCVNARGVTTTLQQVMCRNVNS